MATSWVVSSSRGAPWFNAAQRHSPLDLQAAAAAAAAKHLISHPHVRGVVKLSRSTGPKRMLAAFSSSSGASRRAPNPQTIEDVIEQAQKAVERALEEGKLRQLLQILLPVDQRQFNFLDTEPRNFSGFHQTQIRSTCSYNLRAQKLLLSVNCSQEDGDVDRATSSVTVEPKWKQKLAAADDHAERTRQRTQLAQEEYKQKQAALQRLQGDMSKEVIPLRDLEFLPYLSEEGLMTNCSEPNAKASVYAIFDKDKVLQYIGISRQVYMSMRLHFARMPMKCYHVKVQNITKPSRSLLELIRDKWIDESGSLPKGNDNGPEQSAWENPLDCKPMMTGEEIHKFKEANPGPPKAKVLKNVARRVEAQLENYYQERNCKERLRFDPKLKEKGLLDLKNS